jgi:hypothetical protein
MVCDCFGGDVAHAAQVHLLRQPRGVAQLLGDFPVDDDHLRGGFFDAVRFCQCRYCVRGKVCS